MENVVIILIVALIVAFIVRYLYKAKKNGQACIGCPYSKQCAGKQGGCNGGCNSSCRNNANINEEET